MIKYIIDTKSYKKDPFIINNFQYYIEIYFTKMYLDTKDNKYYDKYLENILTQAVIVHETKIKINKKLGNDNVHKE